MLISFLSICLESFFFYGCFLFLTPYRENVYEYAIWYMELQRRFTVLHTALRFDLCSVRLQVPCFKCHSKITWLTAESFTASFCLIDKRLCSDLVFNLVAETCLKLEAREIVFFFVFFF